MYINFVNNEFKQSTFMFFSAKLLFDTTGLLMLEAYPNYSRSKIFSAVLLFLSWMLSNSNSDFLHTPQTEYLSNGIFTSGLLFCDVK